MDATLKNQLFEYYNFALYTQDDSCTLNALKMHLVFGSALFQKTGSLRQLNVQGSGFDFHFLYGKVVSESYLVKS